MIFPGMKGKPFPISEISSLFLFEMPPFFRLIGSILQKRHCHIGDFQPLEFRLFVVARPVGENQDKETVAGIDPQSLTGPAAVESRPGRKALRDETAFLVPPERTLSDFRRRLKPEEFFRDIGFEESFSKPEKHPGKLCQIGGGGKDAGVADAMGMGRAPARHRLCGRFRPGQRLRGRFRTGYGNRSGLPFQSGCGTFFELSPCFPDLSMNLIYVFFK